MKSWSVAQWFTPLTEGQSLKMRDESFKAATNAMTIEVTATADQGFIVRCGNRGLNDAPYLLIVADNLEELGQAVLSSLADARIR